MTTTSAPSARLEHINPKLLKPNGNVRADLGDLTGLTTSIKAVGLLQPVVVRLVDDIATIVAGKRRTAASIKAGLDTVPCYVIDGIDADADHILAGLGENLQRKDLTAIEEADAYQQLVLLEIEPEAIAAAAGVDVDRVTAGLQVAAAKAKTKGHISKHELTLDQAAGVAEFADDAKAYSELLNTLQQRPEQFDHELSRQRLRSDTTAQIKQRAAEFEGSGYTVVFARPSYYNSTDKAGRLDYLRDDKGKTLTAVKHRECPGRAVVLEASYQGDHFDEVEFCKDWRKNGHAHMYGSGSSGSSKSSASSDVRSEAEKAKAAAARKEVVEGNAAWRAAAPVRKEFLKNLIGRKVTPKGLVRFTTQAILCHNLNGGAAFFDDISGVKPTEIDKTAATATDAKLQLLLFAQVAAALEAGMSEQTWRDGARHWHGPVIGYLQYLESIGYTLSDIEQRVVNGGKPAKPKPPATRPRGVRGARKSKKAAATK